MTQTSTSEHPTRNTSDLANEKQANNSVLLICFYVFNMTYLFVVVFFFFLLVMVKVAAFSFPCPSFKSGLEKERGQESGLFAKTI